MADMATYPAYTVAQCDEMLEKLRAAQSDLVGERLASVSIGTINYTRQNLAALSDAIIFWQRQKHGRKTQRETTDIRI